MQVFLSLLGIVLFVGLVLIHEWGHFMAARRNGVEVEEFGLGFPPRAWSRKRKSGLVLSLNWLPLGGFVRLKGEHDLDERPGSFGAASLPAKTKIMLAGVAENLLAGLVLLTILAVTGMPKIITKEWSGVDQFTVASDTKLVRQEVRAGIIEPNSPAAAIGLGSQDIIVNINGVAVHDTRQLHDLTPHFAGQSVQVSYRHNGNLVDKQVTLRDRSEVGASLKTNSPKGYLGVEPIDLQVRRSTWSAPVVAAGFTWQLTVLTLQGLWHAISGLGSTIAGLFTSNEQARQHGQQQASAQVGGPVAIAQILWGSGALGLSFVLMIIAVISLTLAIFNVLPIPALDGGRLVVTLISRWLKRPLSPATEDLVHGTGMAILLMLVVLITIIDVKRF